VHVNGIQARNNAKRQKAFRAVDLILDRANQVMIKLGVLISGSGTNLQAIIDAIAAGKLDASVELVISSKPDAYGLKRAQEAGIPTIALSKEVYNEPLAADLLIAKELQSAGADKCGVDYVVMAGYMRMVRQPILDAFPNRVINIHPALLPSFVGAHGISDAFDYGVKLTGITVHFANADYDKGPIIAQRAITIEEADTLETLEQRVHAVEHVILPEVLQLVAEGRVRVDESGKVRIATKG
jgi:phosphoribosylglycinamide formyltransferase-1